MVPPESFFGLIDTGIAVYLVSFFCFVITAIFLYLRVFRLIFLGQPADRFDHPVKRLFGAIPYIFLQTKVLQSVSFKRDLAGLAHSFIFWGFLSFVLSYILFIFGDSGWAIFAEPNSEPLSSIILTETGTRIFATYIDIVAGCFLVVLAWSVLRRWVFKPHRLSFDLTKQPESIIIIMITTTLIVLTLFTEAFYIASGSNGPDDSVPIGSAISKVIISIGINNAGELHDVFWWLHLFTILGFGMYIPLSKHMHIIASPLSFVFRDLQPMGTLSTPKNLETLEVFGASKPEDFTWKELLDSYACAICGRCTESCPAHITGKSLSPMHIVQNMKTGLSGMSRNANNDQERHPSPLIGSLISEDALWDCLTCGACEQECPVGVEHIDSIVDMRRNLVMEQAKMPASATNALTSMEQRGHPWRGTPYNRIDWTVGLDVKTLAQHPSAEVLFWVGCNNALEKRNHSIARSMVSILNRAKVDFAILGEEEACTGDPARRLGNEYLYQTMAQQNIDTMTQYDVKKIITTCPHCFNVIKNEYPHLGGQYNVLHYSEFVADLIEQGKIAPKLKTDETISYHDSCYLGRHNGIYDQPRKLLNTIPGLEIIEMGRCKDKGFCCGAGGGHMWMEESGGKRINKERIEEFVGTGASTLGVSCPFCLQMLSEGIESAGQSGNKKVRDVLELLDESLDGENQSQGPSF